MNIIVCLKQVPDTASQIHLLNINEGIDESGLEWVINPYDEFALEEALKIRQHMEGEIDVISVGPPRSTSALRRALAMGADRAHLVESTETMDPACVTSVLAEVIKTRTSSPDIILMGKVGVDENHSASGSMLAERLEMNHVGFITKLSYPDPQQKEQTFLAERLMHGFKEQIRFSLPILITVDKGINQPRYPSLPGIIQAKKKKLNSISLSSLKNSSCSRRIQFHSYSLPSKPPAARLLSGSPEEQVKELVRCLKEKEKVI